jgi:hypothetical protein
MISLSMTAWLRYYQAFAEVRKQPGRGIYLTSELPNDMQQTEGALVIVHWPSSSILAVKPLPMPQGFLEYENKLLVALRKTNEIAIISGNDYHAISHPLLANIHTIDKLPSCKGTRPSSRGEDVFLVTSADTDLIAEINLQGEIVWEWWAMDHGFDQLPSGLPLECKKSTDRRPYTSISAENTTHVNSAIYMDADTILATFFHQGYFVKISKSTGKYEVIMQGLSHPHSVRRRYKRVNDEEEVCGYLLSDSCHHRILLFNEKLELEREVKTDLTWIQDSCEFLEREPSAAKGEERDDCSVLYSLSNVQIKNITSDSTETNNVVELRYNRDRDSFLPSKSLNFSKQDHLYYIKNLSPEQAKYWVEAWKENTFVMEDFVCI